MNPDLRRSKRFNDFIAVTVTIQKEGNKTMHKGPFAGRIINISHHGACLLMSLDSFATYEMYCSTSESNKLQLDIEASSSQKQFSLSGHPVWTDPFTIDDLSGCKIGVEFYKQAATYKNS